MEDLLKWQLRASYAAWLATEQLYENFARRWGLSYNELFVLYAIDRGEPPVSQSRICEIWFMPKQTVHSVLQAFEQQGYVTAEPDPRDRRNKTLYLTETGRIFAQKVLSALDRAELSALERMTAAERENLLHCNRLYHENLADAMKEKL